MNSIMKIQLRLKELGIDPGPIDGKKGPKTEKAIKAFQKIHGLKQDGKVGPKTRAEMWPALIQDRDDTPLFPEDQRTYWPRQNDVMGFYGGVGMNQTMLHVPYPMKLAWDKKQKITRFSIHEKCHDSAKRVLTRVADAYSSKDISKHGFDLFGGCLNVRKMRGGTRYSMHSWGIAIDFDPERNQLKWGRNRAYLAKPECARFLQLWEEEGWLSLGRARDYDWMHVQAARL